LAVEFGAPAELVSQGDLVLAAPSVYVVDLGYLVKIDTNLYRMLQHAPASRRLDRDQPANATEVRRPGIVLTHDCEIDKNHTRASLIVSQVRPLSDVPESDRDGFRDNTRHRAFYLPPGDFLDYESYADLRAITVLRASAFADLERVASMNEDGRRMLREQLFRFYTRRYLPDAWGVWPEDP
jgi:hypothetical protein